MITPLGTKDKLGKSMTEKRLAACRANFAKASLMNKIVRDEKWFFEKVDVRGPDECWPWTGAYNNTGYGVICLTRKKSVMAHRFLWELRNGPLDRWTYVCHKCDNRICVNPNHHFTGSAADNAHDRDAKGRQVPSKLKGEEVGNSKLKEHQVVEIKIALKGGAVQADLAEQYSISQNVISRIGLGKSWKHVTNAHS